MVEVAWAAIALGFGGLAVLATAVFRLGSRIDATNARIDTTNARIDSGFASINARLDTLATQLAEHIRRHAG